MKIGKPSVQSLTLPLILLLGAALRIHGLDWDGGHWLHPDERQIYFVTAGLAWPSTLPEALSPSSPLNPRFFAYGSLPFYMLKLTTVLLAPVLPILNDPDNLHLVGRPLAVIFDLGTIYLTYRLASSLLPGRDRRSRFSPGPLLAAALVSLAVLQIQLAHFYTSDPILTFFVMLTLSLAADVALGGSRWRVAGLGIALGLALATKLSAALLILPVLVACYQRASKKMVQGKPTETQSSDPASILPGTSRCLVSISLLAVLTVILTQPYAIIDWQRFLADTMRESQIAWGWLDAPYTRQYAGTLPFLYPMWQTALWGLGLPVGLGAWTALGAALFRWWRRGTSTTALSLAWAGPYLAVTGLLYAKYLRYMLPLVPVLFILILQLLSTRKSSEPATGRHSSAALAAPSNGRRPWSIIRHPSFGSALAALFVLLSFAYALAFSSIYAEPHSWITASQWIYEHVPPGSTLAVEEWDTALPLPLEINGLPRRIEEYVVQTLPLYSLPDDEAKWTQIAGGLSQSDYVIIASRRLYGSIPRQPDRYLLATRYYELMFRGELGFEPDAEFTRGAGWLNPRSPPLPGGTPQLLLPDESYVVYDHPRAFVLRNVDRLDPRELLERLR